MKGKHYLVGPVYRLEKETGGGFGKAEQKESTAQFTNIV